MVLTTPLPSPSKHHPALIYEHHPDLGDYIYSPSIDSWTHLRATSEGGDLLLTGWGRSPSEDQIRLWRSIEARLPELAEKAIASVPDPPTLPREAAFDRVALWLLRIMTRGRIARSRDAEFDRVALSLREVRLESDDSFALFLDTPFGDLIDMWPMIEFSSWNINNSEWVA